MYCNTIQTGFYSNYLNTFLLSLFSFCVSIFIPLTNVFVLCVLHHKNKSQVYNSMENTSAVRSVSLSSINCFVCVCVYIFHIHCIRSFETIIILLLFFLAISTVHLLTFRSRFFLCIFLSLIHTQ